MARARGQGRQQKEKLERQVGPRSAVEVRTWKRKVDGLARVVRVEKVEKVEAYRCRRLLG